jgi:hypothetical protein
MGVTFQVPPPSIAPLGAHVDCFLSAMALTPVNYATPIPTPVFEPFHQLTALLNFLPEPVARLRFRTLAGAVSTHFSHHAFSIHPTMELAEHLNRAPGAFATAVVALPSCPRDLPDATAPSRALRTLRRSVHLFNTVVGVTEDPKAWQEHLEIEHWVTCEVGGTADAAEQMFAILATLMSPDTLTCIDENTIVDTLGTCSHPARIAPLLWIANSSQLIWLDSAARARATRVQTAIAFPLSGVPKLETSGRIFSAVRTVLPHTASLCISACSTLPALALSSPLACPVLLLHRSDAHRVF